jgi:iron complex transport system substrate-binding protein
LRFQNNFLKLIFLIHFALFFSCSSLIEAENQDVTRNSFAKGFEIIQYPHFTQIIIKNPWQKSQGESFTYILSSDPESLPDSLRSKTIIKTPVNRVIVFSTTHVGFIASLSKSSTIVGVSGKDFISDSTVRSSLEKKECLDIGFAPNIDFESILLLKPDLVFLYGLDPSVSSLVKRLEDAGIKSVLVSEFLEDHPLGKAEWIKFFSVFFESEDSAENIYSEVMQNYEKLKLSCLKQTEKPLVLVGLPWKDTWYMAGGKSFTSKFIEDAGGLYLWNENLNSDFIPLDLESVFQKSVNADIWINIGSAASRSEILSIDPRLSYLPAFQKGMLFNNNLRINATGGNDFWESGAVRPDWVLHDLISIFHGDSSVSTDLYFYQKLD